jgi:hypothetical protein
MNLEILSCNQDEGRSLEIQSIIYIHPFFQMNLEYPQNFLSVSNY